MPQKMGNVPIKGKFISKGAMQEYCPLQKLSNAITN